VPPRNCDLIFAKFVLQQKANVKSPIEARKNTDPSNLLDSYFVDILVSEAASTSSTELNFSMSPISSIVIAIIVVKGQELQVKSIVECQCVMVG
jgi:hypothetical protein